MNRYHKKVYFSKDSQARLRDFTNLLNGKKWRYTRHSIDNIKHRAIDIEDMLLYIKNISILDYTCIFEYYEFDTKIVKVCYRLPYTKDLDIILVLSNDKEIITIYLNSKDDLHFTLKKELYTQRG